jgi:hypothetical protein
MTQFDTLPILTINDVWVLLKDSENPRKSSLLLRFRNVSEGLTNFSLILLNLP